MEQLRRRSEVHPEAHALTLFRVLKDGRGREYTATTFPQNPWRGCEQMIRMARAVGAIEPPADGDCYAVLDVLNEAGDIVDDYAVPSARGFQWLKRKLDLRVEATDG